MKNVNKEVAAKAIDKSSIPSVVSAFETDLINLALPSIQNIQNAFQLISTKPSDPLVLAQQEAVIIANFNTLLLQAPAAIPLLRSTAIAAGAAQAAILIGKIVEEMQRASGATNNDPTVKAHKQKLLADDKAATDAALAASKSGKTDEENEKEETDEEKEAREAAEKDEADKAAALKKPASSKTSKK